MKQYPTTQQKKSEDNQEIDNFFINSTQKPKRKIERKPVKRHKVIKKESSVVFDQIWMNNMIEICGKLDKSIT